MNLRDWINRILACLICILAIWCINMKTSKAGADLIKQYEGLNLTPYICPAGKLTVGYGHTNSVSGTISELEAEELLQKDLEQIEKQLEQRLTVKVNENQFSALVSFVYNLGITRFDNSTLKKLINQGKFKEAANEFPKWVHAGGKKLKGLEARREAEKKLFLT